MLGDDLGLIPPANVFRFYPSQVMIDSEGEIDFSSNHIVGHFSFELFREEESAIPVFHNQV